MNASSPAEAAVDQVPDMHLEQANWFLTGDALRYYRMGHQEGLRAAAEAAETAQANPVECTLDELVRAEIVPARIRLRIGTLEVEAVGNADGQAIPVFGSTVHLDGQPFPVTSLCVKGDVGSAWTVAAEFYPRGVLRAQSAAQQRPAATPLGLRDIRYERVRCAGPLHPLKTTAPAPEMQADGARPCAAALEYLLALEKDAGPTLVTAPDESSRCCVLDAGGTRCRKPARYWVGSARPPAPAIGLTYTYTCHECGIQENQTSSVLFGATSGSRLGVGEFIRPALPDGWQFAGNFLLCPKHKVLWER